MEVRKVLSGRLNLDDVIDDIPEGDWTYMLDGVIGMSLDGKRGSVENMMGTTYLVSEVDMWGGKCIGGCRDPKTNTYFLFFYNPNPAKHTIVKVFNNVVTKVMTWSGLNFNQNYKITGAVFLNDYLFFTDDLNGLRGFNINNHLTPETNPTHEEQISLMKRGGIYAPTFVKEEDLTVSIDLIRYKDFQFCYQYIYKDNQYSVTSPYSALCPRNIPGDTVDYNKIKVSIPTAETIPADVKEIKFAMRVGNNGPTQYIGTLKRTTDNFATRYLNFYNTVYGGSVPTDYLSNYHDVPLRAKCLEFIKNRLWIANYTDGYDVPAAQTLSFAVTNIASLAVSEPILTPNTTFWRVKKWTYSAAPNGTGGTLWTLTDNIEEAPEILANASAIDQISVHGDLVTLNAGNYDMTTPDYDILGSNLVPQGALDITHIGFDFDSPYAVATGDYFIYKLKSQTFTGTLVTYPTEDDLNVYNGDRTFPNNSSYKGALLFKDRWGRESSISKPIDINTAGDGYSNRISINWSLYWGPALAIPEWAESYHIVLTRNLTKDMFFEWQTVRIKYYKQVEATITESSDGLYNVDNTGIKIDVTPMVNIGFGYVWKEGDRIILYKPDGAKVYNLAINSFDGSHLFLSNENIGAITDETIAFEIYRPKIVTEDLLYYEVGAGFPVLYPGTENRAFSVINGKLNGDCFNVKLPMYTHSGTAYTVGLSSLFKEMSLDIKSNDWNTDIGKGHIESSIGQVTKPFCFKHSAPSIDETQTNGFSEWYSGDSDEVSIENGEINKLKSATRTASDGTVLLAICRNRVASIYVDESRVSLTKDVSYLVSGSKVIGEVNTLSGWYGTTHPESVFDNGQSIYWYCDLKRGFVRYSQAGIDAISKYKVMDFFNDSTSLHSSADSIVGGFFPFYDIACVTFPNNPVGRQTISFFEDTEHSNQKQGWRGFHSFTADHYFDLGEVFYSVQGDIIYRHDNVAACGTFQDQPRKDTIIDIPLNNHNDIPKVWQTALLYLAPQFVEWHQGDQRITASSFLRVDLGNENGQSTNVLSHEFEIDEYLAYAPFKFDINSTGGLVNGDEICSRMATLRLSFAGDSLRYIPMLKVGFIPSLGHSL
jgi:hypothetical protein